MKKYIAAYVAMAVLTFGYVSTDYTPNLSASPTVQEMDASQHGFKGYLLGVVWPVYFVHRAFEWGRNR